LYPENWNVCRLTTALEIRDFLGGVQFTDAAGLPHVSIYVYSNPDRSVLEDWVRTHAGEVPSEQKTIGGERALFVSTSAEGTPTAGAYFARGDRVFGISSLKLEDFNAIAGQFSFSQE
jgi:hypothetical protein